ncbi:MAG TPA: hypothetical protein VMT91_12100 [Anaerolineales bacterium]|nr:hypothetical protein [Anaerolineales bacterium]
MTNSACWIFASAAAKQSAYEIVPPALNTAPWLVNDQSASTITNE